MALTNTYSNIYTIYFGINPVMSNTEFMKEFDKRLSKVEDDLKNVSSIRKKVENLEKKVQANLDKIQKHERESPLNSPDLNVALLEQRVKSLEDQINKNESNFKPIQEGVKF